MSVLDDILDTGEAKNLKFEANQKRQIKELTLNIINSVPMDTETYERLCKKVEAL